MTETLTQSQRRILRTRFRATRAELEVAMHVNLEKTEAQIAADTGRSQNTVHAILYKFRKKFNLKSNVGVALWYERNVLINAFIAMFFLALQSSMILAVNDTERKGKRLRKGRRTKTEYVIS